MANYYYINTKNFRVFTAKTNNQAYIEITDDKDVKTKIGINIQNECFDGKKCKNSGTANLTDLTVDDKKVGFFKKEKILSCFDAEGLGGRYKENVQLEYKGVSKDMKKVYFFYWKKVV